MQVQNVQGGPAVNLGGVTITSVTPGSGGAGDQIVITGSGFTVGQAVLVGTVTAANISVDSSIQITCNVPTGVAAGAQNVSVAGVTLSPGFVNALKQLTFEGWADTAALVADAGNVFTNEDVNINTTTCTLETRAGPTGVGTAKVMRYHYPITSTADYSISRHWNFGASLTEAWGEVWLSFSTDFDTDGPAAGNIDLKTMFIRVTPDSRGEVKFGVNVGRDIICGAPENEAAYDTGQNAVTGTSYFDGTWTGIRWHLKLGTGDGIAEFWLNKNEAGWVRYVNQTTVNTGNTTSMYGYKICGNLNKGSSIEKEIDQARWRVWNTNPGW